MAGRKLQRSDSKTVIVRLVNKALDRGDTMSGLAVEIDTSGTTLWSAYRGLRPLPVMPLVRLCLHLGMTEADAIKQYEKHSKEYKKPQDA